MVGSCEAHRERDDKRPLASATFMSDPILASDHTTRDAPICNRGAPLHHMTTRLWPLSNLKQQGFDIAVKTEDDRICVVRNGARKRPSDSVHI